MSKPSIDGYVLQLGVNDYRYNPSATKCNKAISDTKQSIETILERSSAKILVSLPTPTPGKLDEYTTQYIKSVSEFITEKRGIANNFNRLFTLNNHSCFLKVIESFEKTDDITSSSNPLEDDVLHLSPYGVKKLCTNIKFSLYRTFGTRVPVKRAPAERRE